MRSLLITVVACASCTTTAKVVSLPGTGMHANPLARDEYVILGDAEGKACVEESCFFGFICTEKTGTDVADRVEGRLNTTNVQAEAPGFFVPGFSGAGGTSGNGSAAEQAALYQAIESVPDADALMAPRKSMEITTDTTLISSTQRACVRVFGKGIRLKTDAEIAGMTTSVPAEPPPPPPSPLAPEATP